MRLHKTNNDAIKCASITSITHHLNRRTLQACKSKQYRVEYNSIVEAFELKHYIKLSQVTHYIALQFKRCIVFSF